MNATTAKLLKIEKEYGPDAFLDRQRAVALIKDLYIGSKREIRLLEKGIELNIYKKIINLPATDILIFKATLMKILCDEHGLQEDAAETTIDMWINLVEEKRHVKILDPYTVDRKKALHAYKQNVGKSNDVTDKTAAVYDANTHYATPTKKILKQPEDKRNQAQVTADDAIKTGSESLSNKPLHGVLGNTLFQLREFEEAARSFKAGAEQGNTVSQNNLAYCYLYGKGVKKNTYAALEWFTKAARRGDLTAMVNLANCYYDGIGVSRDILKALSWYAEAARLGDANSQYILGECFYRGEGVRKSKIDAVKWFEKAAAQNHSEAAERLKELNYYAEMLRVRNLNEKKQYENIEVSVNSFISRTVAKIRNDDLRRNTQIHSYANNLISIAKNHINGLGLRLDTDEQPIFLYNDSPGNSVRLSDVALFTTKGIHMHQNLLRTTFLSYAKITDIRADKGGKKRICINKYYINCSSLRSEAINQFIVIINEAVKEFR